MKWLLIVGALVIVIVIIVVIIAGGGAASDSDKSSKQVSPAEYAAIKQGDSIASVKAGIGAEPESEDQFEVNGTKLDCIYYGVLSSEGTYQFCFENGKLFSKSKM